MDRWLVRTLEVSRESNNVTVQLTINIFKHIYGILFEVHVYRVSKLIRIEKTVSLQIADMEKNVSLFDLKPPWIPIYAIQTPMREHRLTKSTDRQSIPYQAEAVGGLNVSSKTVFAAHIFSVSSRDRGTLTT
jgi:hypothetical protein